MSALRIAHLENIYLDTITVCKRAGLIAVMGHYELRPSATLFLILYCCLAVIPSPGYSRGSTKKTGKCGILNSLNAVQATGFKLADQGRATIEHTEYCLTFAAHCPINDFSSTSHEDFKVSKAYPSHQHLS